MRRASQAILSGVLLAASFAGADEPPPSSAAHNFCLRLSEEFCNRVVERRRHEIGTVRDFIAGADVYGNQVTQSRTSLDLRPCPSAIWGELVLEGLTHSRTVGVTPQAVVGTDGCHRFRMVKPVYFDGTRLLTGRPVASVAPRNVTMGIDTPLSRWPILGPLAGRQAYIEAERRRPQAEWEAAAHLAERVAAQFNTTADHELARISRLLRSGLERRPTTANVPWRILHASSSETAIDVRAHVGGALPVGTSAPVHSGTSVVGFHESAANAVLETLPLRGAALTDRQIDALIERLARLLAGQNPGDPPGHDATAAARLYTLLLDSQQPLRVRLVAEQLQVVLRGAIQPVIGNKTARKEIVIPLSAAVKGDRLILQAGTVSVATAGPDGDGVADLLTDNLIRQEVESRLKPIDLPRRFHLPLKDAPHIPLAVSQIRCESGWLLVVLDE